MTPTEFSQWLRGFLDASGDAMTAGHVQLIKDKLATVISPPVNWGTGPAVMPPSFPAYPPAHPGVLPLDIYKVICSNMDGGMQ